MTKVRFVQLRLFCGFDANGVFTDNPAIAVREVSR